MSDKKMRGFLIANLLVGEWYRSPNSSKEGEIVFAEKSDYSENAYLITYRDPSSIKEQHATIEVCF